MENKPKAKKAEVTHTHPVDDFNQVVTVKGGKFQYRKEPCADCPWRVDAIGAFPSGAFRVSAHTAYDMAKHTFGCHSSGSSKPATCAGFLLRGAQHNLSVRLAYSMGRLKQDVSDGGHELHDSYRAMAIANGVDPDDPVLTQCRD